MSVPMSNLQQNPEATAVSLTGRALLEAPLLNTRTLPVILAVGTDNPALLADHLYLGWHHQRVRGADYDAFLESFVQAVQRCFPQVLLQWEDFARQHARRVLERYRDRLCTFNDDIQGTGAVTLAGLLATLSLTSSELSEQRIVIVGAGSAATGIAEQLVAALVSEGVSVEAARRLIWLVDTHGLVHTRRSDLAEEKRSYAQPWERVAAWSLSLSGTIELDEGVARVHRAMQQHVHLPWRRTWCAGEQSPACDQRNVPRCCACSQRAFPRAQGPDRLALHAGGSGARRVAPRCPGSGAGGATDEHRGTDDS